MTKESDTLRIVKEDILRRLGEEKTEKIALGSIKLESNASYSFVSQAVKKLERESLIEQHNGLVSLTKKEREAIFKEAGFSKSSISCSEGFGMPKLMIACAVKQWEIKLKRRSHLEMHGEKYKEYKRKNPRRPIPKL